MAPSAVEVDMTNGLHADPSPNEAPSTTPKERNQRHEEYQYLDLIRDILDNGEHRPDRTGTGTYSVPFPPQLRFSLSKPTPTATNPHATTPILPLLTTKRVFLRAVLAELLWFVAGSTSSLPLSAQGIKIWDGNGSRAYLDSVGLAHRAEGDLGPVYGFQWRHFGAQYVDAAADYAGQGVDQLAEVVRKLKHAPYDRRIILSAWNPADLPHMALPPCHMFAQFYVSFPGAKRRREREADAAAASAREDSDAAAAAPAPAPAPAANGPAEPPPAQQRGTLHTLLYQRSCDMGLGVPFNIASYALLTHMLAHECGLEPGSLTHTMGDAHVYADHVDALEVQLAREPRAFPTLAIRREAGGGVDGWAVEDFEVSGYKPHGKIEMKMSV